MQTFTWRFGTDPEGGIPDLPGIYHLFDETGVLLYVGKAKSLKRRLAQYRVIRSRKKKYKRMKRIVATTHTIRIFVLPSHLEACLQEVRDIQALKPSLNIASTFSAMYPFVGVQRLDKELRFGFTTKVDELQGFTLFGAFRTREVTAEAFFSLMRLFTMVGHRSKLAKKDRPQSRYTSIVAFRLLPDGYESAWSRFLKGESREALGDLVLRLLENAGARTRAGETQDEIDALLRFWESECRPLARAIEDSGYAGPYPVPQTDRDPLFLQSKFARGERHLCPS